VLTEFWNYTGAFILALIMIYGTGNHLVTLFAGFVVFCVFYFSYGFNDKNFLFSATSALKALGHAGLLYIIPYSAAVILYAVTKRIKKIRAA
jgi:hypothetical protein